MRSQVWAGVVMGWKYEQATGKLFDKDNTDIATGYAGRALGKNNPAMQDVKGIGPLPCGMYTIYAPHDSTTVGKYAMRLLPDPQNEMFGRSSFYMHGDAIHDPGNASHGCIVMDRTVRELVWDSGDHRLQVVSGAETVAS